MSGDGAGGALQAARELAAAWLAEQRGHGEPVPVETAALLGHIELSDAVLAS